MYIKAVFTFQKTIAAWKNKFFKKYFFCIMSYMIQLYQIFIYVCQTILPALVLTGIMLKHSRVYHFNNLLLFSMFVSIIVYEIGRIN